MPGVKKTAFSAPGTIRHCSAPCRRVEETHEPRGFPGCRSRDVPRRHYLGSDDAGAPWGQGPAAGRPRLACAPGRGAGNPVGWTPTWGARERPKPVRLHAAPWGASGEAPGRHAPLDAARDDRRPEGSGPPKPVPSTCTAQSAPRCNRSRHGESPSGVPPGAGFYDIPARGPAHGDHPYGPVAANAAHQVHA